MVVSQPRRRKQQGHPDGNRRARRAAKFKHVPTDVKVPPVHTGQRRKQRPPADVVWHGRCACDACKGRAWPHVYMVTPMVRRTGEDVPRVIGRYEEKPPVSYECMIDAQAPKPGKRVTGGLESPSVAAIRWLEQQGAEASEVALAAEDDDGMLTELARHQSFVRWAVRTEPDPSRHRGMEKRFLEICRMFDDNPHRLMGYLYREFPGWISLVRVRHE